MTRKRSMLLLGLAAALVVSMASPAPAHTGNRIEVTRGEFVTLQGGTDLGYTISGKAVMVRLRKATLVGVWVRGLDADTTYPAHVHNAPCSATPPGGSHYQHQVGGPVDAVNEIWPIVTTGSAGRGFGSAWHTHRARPDAMSIVIHYPPDTSIRLACADLS
ncbi:MAG TPA: hypothetical protein VGC11_06705 [Acidimicrobiia bacterium]|jgi:hypothetical protein